MLKFYKTSIFKSLQQEWYERLKSVGFEDYELPSGNLKDMDPRYKEKAFKDREKREAYYARASDVLHRFKFKSERDRTVWEFHVWATPVRIIAARLQMHPATVQYIIQRLRQQTKLERTSIKSLSEV